MHSDCAAVVLCAGAARRGGEAVVLCASAVHSDCSPLLLSPCTVSSLLPSGDNDVAAAPCLLPVACCCIPTLARMLKLPPP